MQKKNKKYLCAVNFESHIANMVSELVRLRRASIDDGYCILCLCII